MTSVGLLVLVVAAALVVTKWMAVAAVLVIWSAWRAVHLAKRDAEWYGGYKTAVVTFCCDRQEPCFGDLRHKLIFRKRLRTIGSGRLPPLRLRCIIASLLEDTSSKQAAGRIQPPAVPKGDWGWLATWTTGITVSKYQPSAILADTCDRYHPCILLIILSCAPPDLTALQETTTT
jgi:hypothetical protein